jgi:hypothetical protein
MKSMDREPFNKHIDKIEPGVPLPLRALYRWEGRALYVGEIVDNTPHSHHALQIVKYSGRFYLIDNIS